jgi:hypothetical protein
MNINPYRAATIFLDWTKTKLSKRQFILLSSVLVGLSVGLAAIVLKLFVHYHFFGSNLQGVGQYEIFIFNTAIHWNFANGYCG